MRLAILGNAASGKSTLGRSIAARTGLALHETDRMLWSDGWQQVPDETYTAAHEAAMAGDAWIIEGLGLKPSLSPRIARATHVILCDFPTWQTFWRLTVRHEAWLRGTLEHTPGAQQAPPDLRRMFELIGHVDANWMPDIRAMVGAARAHAEVHVIASFEELCAFDPAILG